MGDQISSATDVDDGARQIRRCFDGLGIGLEVTLCGDQVDEFFRQIDVRPLKSTTLDGSVSVGACDADDRIARVGRRDVVRITNLLQSVRACEVRQNQFSERFLLTVGVVRANRTRRVDADAVESTGRETVLRERQHEKGCEYCVENLP